MVKDLASRVRRLYNYLGEEIDACIPYQGEETIIINTKWRVYYQVRSKLRDYFPELKLKERLDEKYPGS